MPEAMVPKVGHEPKMGQYGFDRACVSVVFLFLLCFIAHLYEANWGTDMEVLACFRPVFFLNVELLITKLAVTFFANNTYFGMWLIFNLLNFLDKTKKMLFSIGSSSSNINCYLIKQTTKKPWVEEDLIIFFLFFFNPRRRMANQKHGHSQSWV